MQAADEIHPSSDEGQKPKATKKAPCLFYLLSEKCLVESYLVAADLVSCSDHKGRNVVSNDFIFLPMASILAQTSCAPLIQGLTHPSALPPEKLSQGECRRFGEIGMPPEKISQGECRRFAKIGVPPEKLEP